MNAVAATSFFNKPVRTMPCPEHGDYESTNIFAGKWTMCPRCADIGIARREVEEAAQAEIARKAGEATRWEEKLGCAGIPLRFRDRTLSSYDAATTGQVKALKFAHEYADGFDAVLASGRSAVLVGKPGTGKTHLAVGVALAIMERSHTAVFTTTMKALRRIKETWGAGSGESESEAIDTFVFPDLLILDEVGLQHGSDTERLLLFDILNSRYELRRPTLLLSNLTLEEVKAYLGERIFDRMREDGGRVIAFDWASHRGKAGAQEGAQ